MKQQDTLPDLDNHDRLRLILESTTEGWWEWNVLTNETYHSPQWYSMLGFEPDQFASSFDMWTSLMHPEDRAEAMAKQQASLHADQPWELTFRMRTSDAGYRWITSKARVVKRTETGEPWHVVGIHLDVSQQKELEQLKREQEIQEEMLAGILRVSHSSYKIYDFMARKFQYSHGGIVGQLGYTEAEFEELAQDFIEKLVHADDQQKFTSYLSALRGQDAPQVGEMVFRMRAKSGDYHWITTRDSVFRRDEAGFPTQIIGSAIDISARKELEERIEQHINYLEELSYKNSHELRAPVASLLGLMHLLELELGPDLDHKMLDYFKRTVYKMDEVIRDLNREIDERTLPGDS